jgi:ferrous iron transport protein B
MSDARYAKASGVAKEVLSAIQKVKYDITEKLDKMLLNRFLSIPIFLLAMWIVFKIAFDFSSPFVDWIDGVFSGPFSKWVTSSLLLINAPEWTVSLVTDGIIAGTGFVLVFVPVIGVMMLLITFLEASGYMARVAFVMDRFMHTMGLHGKSFIPILLGFGCNVPSVYATRVLENERDRKLTTLLVPLMSCGARLPVYVVFIGAFFTKHSGTVLWSLYVLGIVVAILLGIILKKTMYKDESSIFIMELPPYRLPTLRDLFIHTWLKVKHFIVKAGTYILAVSIIVWFMLNLPWGVENKKDSLLGKVGQVVAPVFEPLGFGKWEAASSLITGLIAKEIVVSTMSQIYVQEENEEQEEDTGFGEDLKEIVVSFGSAVKESFENVFSTFKIASISADESEEDASSHTALRQELNKVFTPLSAYAFMSFVLLYWPCVVVAIAIRQEFGSWKLYGQAIMMHTVVAWIVSFIIYQGGLLLGLGG